MAVIIPTMAPSSMPITKNSWFAVAVWAAAVADNLAPWVWICNA